MSTLLEAGAWSEWVYPETPILLGLFRGGFSSPQAYRK